MPYTPATRKGTHVLIGLTGQSGSGKTHSAILVARGLVGPNGRIAILDTENGRASQCAHLTEFDAQELWPPFTPARYAEKIREAAEAGYDCLIIDSFSHEWEGEGGVLEMADNAKNKQGRPLQGLAKWKIPKCEHKKLVNLILQTRMHIIVCLRGKEKLVQVKGRNGRDEIVSAGVVPIQENRFIYEMTISLMMDEETQQPKIRKCPAELHGIFPPAKHITVDTGAGIAEWIGGGLSVDDDLERLQQTARDVASLGSLRMREYWMSLASTDKARLQGVLPDLQSIAKEADATPSTVDDDADKPEPDPLADPFTDDQLDTSTDRQAEDAA